MSVTGSDLLLLYEPIESYKYKYKTQGIYFIYKKTIGCFNGINQNVPMKFWTLRIGQNI